MAGSILAGASDNIGQRLAIGILGGVDNLSDGWVGALLSLDQPSYLGVVLEQEQADSPFRYVIVTTQ
jgi:hypothetical protein